jgi:hypothetical protein
MPTFKIEMRFRKTVTVTVEAESKEEIETLLDEDLGDVGVRGGQAPGSDSEMYSRAHVFEDWDTSFPFQVSEAKGNPKADYVIGKTPYGRDFVVKQESERLPGVKP